MPAGRNGADPEAPADLLPKSGVYPTERVFYRKLLIDVVPGRGGGFSLEAPLGVRFLTRSRVFDEAEQQWLEACPPARGPAP